MCQCQFFNLEINGQQNPWSYISATGASPLPPGSWEGSEGCLASIELEQRNLGVRKLNHTGLSSAPQRQCLPSVARDEGP